MYPTLPREGVRVLRAHYRKATITRLEYEVSENLN
jgi:hypothetical protein